MALESGDVSVVVVLLTDRRGGSDGSRFKQGIETRCMIPTLPKSEVQSVRGGLMKIRTILLTLATLFAAVAVLTPST
jgi:hypothetical protein